MASPLFQFHYGIYPLDGRAGRCPRSNRYLCRLRHMFRKIANHRASEKEWAMAVFSKVHASTVRELGKRTMKFGRTTTVQSLNSS